MIISKINSENIDAVEGLAADADREGCVYIRRTCNDWKSGTECFDSRGELLLGCFDGGRCIALGGLCLDPFTDEDGIGRLRRVYVVKERRREGIGRKLVSVLLAHAWDYFPKVRLYTENAAAAGLYENLGFQAEPENRSSHCIVFTPQYMGN